MLKIYSTLFFKYYLFCLIIRLIYDDTILFIIINIFYIEKYTHLLGTCVMYGMNRLGSDTYIKIICV